MSSTETPLRVLFICTGNTCRSPLAVGALLRDLGSERERVEVTSAGVAAWEGQPATEASVEVAAADGIDLRSHRSRRVSPQIVRAADLILVMERAHLASVLALGADPERTHVLSEWPEPGDPALPVSDPFGASREAYEECWHLIKHHMKRVLPALREALRARSA